MNKQILVYRYGKFEQAGVMGMLHLEVFPIKLVVIKEFHPEVCQIAPLSKILALSLC